MASRRCPRCDAIFPGRHPVHLSCFFARLGVLGIAVVVLTVLGTFIRFFSNNYINPVPDVTIQATTVVSTPVPTSVTKSPTYTPKPTRTVVPPTSTITLTPTPEFILLQAYIYAIGTNHVTIETTQAIDGDYRAVVGGMDYQCITIDEYPNRLYCYGNEMGSGMQIQMTIYFIDSNYIVYEGTFWSP